MSYIQQGIFILITILAIGFFTKKIREIMRNIRLGKDEDFSDRKGERWKNVFLLALGQKKMFKRPSVALLHIFIYVGFIIINIEVLEIVLDGMIGTHRMFMPLLGGFYTLLIDAFEFLAILVLIACIAFLIRRNVIRVKRLNQKELDGWPRSDANYILITEIILMCLFLSMNASDRALQLNSEPGYHDTGDFIVSGMIASAFSGLSNSTVHIFERSAWWLHIVGIFAFLNYLPWSKHLHILLAFPNAYFTRLLPLGKIENMPAVQNEVLYAMQPDKAPTVPLGQAPTDATPPSKFGAKDIADLSWRNLLDAYSCTECGRCTSACPANITGKKLSPRKIMMDTRDRTEEIGRIINKEGSFKEDGKTLLHNYITTEELWACTTCNACVVECPVSISPLEMTLELRRSLVMEERKSPAEWNAMFSNIENNFAPWKISPEQRDEWRK